MFDEHPYGFQANLCEVEAATLCMSERAKSAFQTNPRGVGTFILFPCLLSDIMASDDALHEFRPTWAAWFWHIILTVGLFAPIAWWLRRGVRYEVLDDRVVKHSGRISSQTDEFALGQVSRIRTSRSLGEQLLGGGTIVLDTGNGEMRIAATPDHDAVAESIRERVG